MLHLLGSLLISVLILINNRVNFQCPTSRLYLYFSALGPSLMVLFNSVEVSWSGGKLTVPGDRNNQCPSLLLFRLMILRSMSYTSQSTGGTKPAFPTVESSMAYLYVLFLLPFYPVASVLCESHSL